MASRKKTSDNKDEDKLTRIAIVSMDKCKPKRCRQECKKWCPVVRGGGLCIEADPTSKTASISEELCIGCGICVKKCPFDAIQIINLPRNLEKYTTHRYGPNSFKLHRLPMPRPGQCLGLVGSNGTGKSTALKILASKLKPNLGQYSNPPDWEEILKYFRGSELQGYFQRILEDRLKALIKPQYVDIIPKTVKGIVKDLLKQKDERDVMAHYVDDLQLQSILDRDVAALSGGELQRFTIAISCVQKADVYMYDEPSSYLDVKQRLKAAKTIRNMIKSDNYIICVEHDLSVLDYLSINIFLDGFVPTENLRFRDESLNFKITDAELEEIQNRAYQYKYPGMVKTMGGQFKLTVEPGEFTDSEIVVLLGENGTGKTTFIRLLAGIIKPDDEKISIPELMISVKPQTISPKFQGTVKALLQTKIRDAILHPQFSTDVLKPLHLEEIMDQEIQNISGGELQRVAIVLALGKPADVYLLDEPSAFLDSEQRLAASKVIKRFILHAKKTAFVVEHDFIMATYLADRVIVYEGEPSVSAKANSPQSLLNGMNKFLSQLEITFRRDPENFRPRINKGDSVKDKEQKMNGNYFYMDQGDAKPDAKKKAEAAAAAAAAAAASGGGDEKKKEKKEKKKKNEE